MAAYMVQVAYTAEAWGNLVRSPQNRLEAVRPVAAVPVGDLAAPRPPRVPAVRGVPGLVP